MSARYPQDRATDADFPLCDWCGDRDSLRIAMQIDDQCIRDFQQLYRERFGIELSAAEARKEATDLVLLLRMLIEIDE